VAFLAPLKETEFFYTVISETRGGNFELAMGHVAI
jgi:hypothetical protein